MNNLITLLFSTTFLYACVNGGALRGQEGTGYPSSTPGVWPGYTGAPGVPGSPGSSSGLAPGYAPQPSAYSRIQGLTGQGGWSGPGGFIGSQVGWTGPVGHSGAPGTGAWPAPSGYAGAPGVGAWPAPSGYAGAPGVPGVAGSWSGVAGHYGAPGGFSVPNGAVGSPVGYAGPTAVPTILPDGSIADVPEVAAARAAHLSAVQVASSDPRLADADDGEYNPYKYGDHLYFQHHHHSSGPVGYNPNGFGVNGNKALHATTLAEESVWKAKQYAEEQRVFSAPRGNSYANAEAALGQLIAKNAAAAATPSRASGELVRPYPGPLATPQILPSGYVADTAEVNEARQNHLRALAAAEASAAKWAEQKAGWN